MPGPLDETSVSLPNECARWSRRSNCLPSLTGVHFAGRQGRGLGSGVSQPAAARNGRLAKSRRRRERIRWYPVFVVDGGYCSSHERAVARRTRRIWFAKRTSRGISYSPTNGFPFALCQGPQIVDMHGKSREVISRLCRRAKGNRRCAVWEKTTERFPLSWECTRPHQIRLRARTTNAYLAPVGKIAKWILRRPLPHIALRAPGNSVTHRCSSHHLTGQDRPGTIFPGYAVRAFARELMRR